MARLLQSRRFRCRVTLDTAELTISVTFPDFRPRERTFDRETFQGNDRNCVSRLECRKISRSGFRSIDRNAVSERGLELAGAISFKCAFVHLRNAREQRSRGSRRRSARATNYRTRATRLIAINRVSRIPRGGKSNALISSEITPTPTRYAIGDADIIIKERKGERASQPPIMVSHNGRRQLDKLKYPSEHPATRKHPSARCRTSRGSRSPPPLRARKGP